MQTLQKDSESTPLHSSTNTYLAKEQYLRIRVTNKMRFGVMPMRVLCGSIDPGSIDRVQHAETTATYYYPVVL